MQGCHLLVIDLHAPGPCDPEGIHGAVWGELCSGAFRLPADKRMTLVAYSAGAVPRAYVEPIAIGASLPDMPLFLRDSWYVKVPLERIYGLAYASVPQRWRAVIEGQEIRR